VAQRLIEANNADLGLWLLSLSKWETRARHEKFQDFRHISPGAGGRALALRSA
jgi:hypothetical protein